MYRSEEQANYSAYYDGRATLRMPRDPELPVTELKYPEFWDVGITPQCDMGCKFCAKPEALISTATGTKEIQHVRTGDLVYVLDETTGQQEVREVDQLHQRPYTGDLVEIELESGEVLSLTPNHKLHTQRGWVEAGALCTDDTLTQIK